MLQCPLTGLLAGLFPFLIPSNLVSIQVKSNSEGFLAHLRVNDILMIPSRLYTLHPPTVLPVHTSSPRFTPCSFLSPVSKCVYLGVPATAVLCLGHRWLSHPHSGFCSDSPFKWLFWMGPSKTAHPITSSIFYSSFKSFSPLDITCSPNSSNKTMESHSQDKTMFLWKCLHGILT